MEKRRLFSAMVDVNDARAWLESTKNKGMALGLENTASAIAALELPQPAYETVHVAGSNGKGTTVATLGAALNRANLSHVAFTSPHLVRVEERVRINGRPVPAVVFDDALAKVHAIATTADLPLTFFESTLMVALVIAADQQPNVLLLETGLGGRLDATRAVPADVAVITSLSLEHTEILGDIGRHRRRKGRHRPAWKTDDRPGCQSRSSTSTRSKRSLKRPVIPSWKMQSVRLIYTGLRSRTVPPTSMKPTSGRCSLGSSRVRGEYTLRTNPRTAVAGPDA